jgi:hypothetical protein
VREKLEYAAFMQGRVDSLEVNGKRYEASQVFG